MLQEKVRGKFLITFEEALTFAREKDRKLRFQSQNAERRYPQILQLNLNALPTPAQGATTVANQTIDPQVELLQRLTNQLENLSINLVQGPRGQQRQPANGDGGRNRRDFYCHNCGENGHQMYFCPHPRRYGNARGPRQQVSPPR